LEGTEDDYRHYLNSYYRGQEEAVPVDAGESPEIRRVNWDSHLPMPPKDWLTTVTFGLARHEAEYLHQKIVQRAPQSLLAHLLIHQQMIPDTEHFAWELNYQKTLSAKLADQLNHARNFSEVMHGAALLYNLLLARQQPSKRFVKHYEMKLAQWADIVHSRHEELVAWNRSSFWKMLEDCTVRVPPRTRHFTEQWLALVLDIGSKSVAGAGAAVRLVTEREHAVKPGRARLGNLQATEHWEGASGSSQLDFRWNRPVRAVVNDILRPLAANSNHA